MRSMILQKLRTKDMVGGCGSCTVETVIRGTDVAIRVEGTSRSLEDDGGGRGTRVRSISEGTRGLATRGGR